MPNYRCGAATDSHRVPYSPSSPHRRDEDSEGTNRRVLVSVTNDRTIAGVAGVVNPRRVGRRAISRSVMVGTPCWESPLKASDGSSVASLTDGDPSPAAQDDMAPVELAPPLAPRGGFLGSSNSHGVVVRTGGGASGFGGVGEAGGAPLARRGGSWSRWRTGPCEAGSRPCRHPGWPTPLRLRYGCGGRRP